MRIGQLVGFAEKRFSFDLVSRKKPVVEPVETESVEPFESLILRRMPHESDNADEVRAAREPIELPTAQPTIDAPEAPALVIDPPPAPRIQMSAPSAQIEAAAPAALDEGIKASLISPESVMAALTRVNTAPADRAETVNAPEAVVQTRPVAAPDVAAAPAAAVPMPEVAREMPAAAPAPSAVEAPRRATSRARTTFLGFDRSGARTEDVFSKEVAGRANTNRSEFPFGWVVVIDGPGRGTSFAIQDGVSQIGRGDDQMVQLDFGDMGISRTNHAAIAFDDEAQQFLLGHGGKANIVRLNGRPVLSTEPLKHGDTIRIGETTLRFVAFCGEEFVWNKV